MAPGLLWGKHNVLSEALHGHGYPSSPLPLLLMLPQLSGHAMHPILQLRPTDEEKSARDAAFGREEQDSAQPRLWVAQGTQRCF